MGNANKSLALVIVALFLTSLVALPSSTVKASPKTITVPDDYPTIQEAIDNANAGDTVFVEQGVYQEETLEINKPLTLTGEETDKTEINLNPPLVNYTFIYVPMVVHSTAITINANNVKISGFTISMIDDKYNYLGGISANGNNIQISGNKIGKSGDSPLKLSGTLISVINNSLANDLVVNGSNQTIANNLITGNFESQGSFNEIIYNKISQGLNINGSFNLVIGNTISRLFVQNSNYSFISNNSLGRLEIGVFGQSCANNTFCKNFIIGPSLWGILLGRGSENVFHDNLISNYTNGYAIAIGGTHAVAEKNTFYHNLFIDNELDVGANWEVLGSGNFWDNGKIGNYWSKYSGSDSNGDGIGDNPFVVEGRKGDENGGLIRAVFGQDNFPLTKPFNINDARTELPYWASDFLNSSVDQSQSPEQQESEPFPTINLLVVLAMVTVGLIIVASFLACKRKTTNII